ncbi:hypothetical protein [Saccharopolyspora hattusasensis]|uniref:hypothetical protein n=1 Tax=Saccharopolyspora hattusasensis TaxID=1128679 RepID=UPI003D974DFF
MQTPAEVFSEVCKADVGGDEGGDVDDAAGAGYLLVVVRASRPVGQCGELRDPLLQG